MSRKCSSCNAAVDERMRICPNCGRLLQSIGDRHEYQPSGGRAVPAAAKSAGKKPAKGAKKPAHPSQGGSGKKPAAREGAVRREPVHTKPKAHPPAQQEEKELPGWTGIIKRVTVAAVIIAAIYFALFGLQVLRIKKSSYTFDTDMKLSASNYGEAFANSVEDGSWKYNPFTFGMTYSGKHDGKDIEIRFSAGWTLDVESIKVGKEEKTTKEQINIYLMGLFI